MIHTKESKLPIGERNYIGKIMKLYKDGVIPENDISNVEVRHEDDCPMLKGKGYCKCKFDLFLNDKKIG